MTEDVDTRRPGADLKPHRLRIALLQPQIAPNTGNIARLCVATGTELHLVRPMGFVLSDKYLKRSAMDYWPRLKLTVHDDDAALIAAIGTDATWLFTSKAARSLWDASFKDGNWLLFGSESHGLPRGVLNTYRNCHVRIPQIAGERCLNLSTAAGIGIYTALRDLRAG